MSTSQTHTKKRKLQAYVVDAKDDYDASGVKRKPDTSRESIIKIDSDSDATKNGAEQRKSWTKTLPREAGTQGGRSFTSLGICKIIAGTGKHEVTVYIHTKHLKKYSDYFLRSVIQFSSNIVFEHRLPPDIRADIMLIFAEFVYSPDLKEILQRSEYNTELSYWQYQCLAMDIYLWAQKMGCKRFANSAAEIAKCKETGKPMEELEKYRDVLRELQPGECKLRQNIMAHIGGSWKRYQKALDTDPKGKRFVKESPELIAALLWRNTSASERDRTTERDSSPYTFGPRSPRRY
ncbi:hypothetical protein BDD12DRAFT_809394 [Trichophaea hybrida]|nr:hypothetical protein BDD12DRAFT_809394 [Trichophaea hybrida]